MFVLDILLHDKGKKIISPTYSVPYPLTERFVLVKYDFQLMNKQLYLLEI